MDAALKQEIITYLRNYDGEEIRIMEVCGSHTSAIAKCGLKSMLSKKIHLISGPGCPVCVTPSSYIDRLIALSKTPGYVVATFGDLLRVPGSVSSLAQAKDEGGKVVMVYSPMDVLCLAKEQKDQIFVFAAIGFETTTPVYALLLERAMEEGLTNVKLLTSLKTMPMAIDWICQNANHKMDGFLAPGHVASVTGAAIFEPLAKKYQIPFAVAGFSPEHLLMAIYALCKARHQGIVMNLYPSAVNEHADEKMEAMINRYFEDAQAAWRGMGMIEDSGRLLRAEYAAFDAGSKDLIKDEKKNKGCCCDQVLMGNMEPYDCPLFGKVCNPLSPQGACMVSEEGGCHTAYMNRG